LGTKITVGRAVRADALTLLVDTDGWKRAGLTKSCFVGFVLCLLTKLLVEDTRGEILLDSDKIALSKLTLERLEE